MFDCKFSDVGIKMCRPLPKSSMGIMHMMPVW